MLDITRLSEYETIECNFQELPDVMVREINLYLGKGEDPYTCTIQRNGNRLDVQVITPFRVVISSFGLARGIVKFGWEDGKSASYLLSGFTGVRHSRDKRTNFHSLKLQFHSQDIVNLTF